MSRKMINVIRAAVDALDGEHLCRIGADSEVKRLEDNIKRGDKYLAGSRDEAKEQAKTIRELREEIKRQRGVEAYIHDKCVATGVVDIYNSAVGASVDELIASFYRKAGAIIGLEKEVRVQSAKVTERNAEKLFLLGMLQEGRKASNLTADKYFDRYTAWQRARNKKEKAK